MSAHAGILYTEPRPVPRAVVETLSRFNTTLGPDATGLHLGDGVALLSCALHFDRLAIQEQQPVRAAGGGSVLTWDGRLDNRDDFLIRLRPELDGDFTDARLVALALDKWGSETLDELLGDWSLARWDARARELLLACDYCGNRPLYYCQRPDSFVWSTALEPLVELCGLAGHVDDVFMASFLTHQPPDGHTPYRDLRIVSPGQALRVAPGQAPRLSALAPFRARSIRYADARQYEEHYRHLFTDAVRVRLRARAPVWAELSGGYDSSAITCVAADLVRARAVETPAVQPISLDLSDVPESDESRYVRAVDAYCGLRTIWKPFHGAFGLRPPSATVVSVVSVASDDGGEGGGEDRALTGDRVHAAGGQVLMAGSFGDSIAEPVGTRDLLFEHLSARRFRAFFADSLAHARSKRMPLFMPWGALWRLRRSLPQREAQARRERLETAARERHVPLRDVARIFGLRAEFLQRSLRPPVSFADGLEGLPRHAQHLLLWMREIVDDGQLRADLRSLSATRMTFPFTHRPLLEFVLSVPPSTVWHAARHRAFVRAALRDVMPPAVLSRQTKGDGSAVNSRRMTPLVMEMIAKNSFQLVDRGYADRASLVELLRGFLDGTQSTVLSVKRLVIAETMLRRMSARRVVPEVMASAAGVSPLELSTRKGGECAWNTSSPS